MLLRIVSPVLRTVPWLQGNSPGSLELRSCTKFHRGIWTHGSIALQGQGRALGRVCPQHTPFGTFRGNVCHDNNRFGTEGKKRGKKDGIKDL